jgi:outer membrane protein TolC
MTRTMLARSAGAALALCAAVAAPSAAQTTAPASRPLSLDAAFGIADTVSDVVRIARQAISRAQGQQEKARSQYLPQITGSISYTRTLASEYSNLTGTTQGPPPCSNFPIDSTLPIGQRVTQLENGFGCQPSSPFANLPFGQPNRYSLGLNLTQNIFTGGRLNATTNAAAAGVRSAGFTLTEAQAQLILTVTQTYYDAALSDRLVDIARASLAQAETTLVQAQLGRQVGARPEFDVLRAEVTRDNQRPIVIQRMADQAIAHTRLAQLLRLPPEQPLLLTTELGDTSAAASARLAEIIANAPDTSTDARAPVRQANENVFAQHEGITVAKSQWYPQFTLSSAWGKVGYPSSYAPPPVNDFRTNWSITGALAFPIFTGGNIHGDVVIAQANWRDAMAQMRIVRQTAQLDARDAVYRLMAAQATWTASVGTADLAARAYAIAEVRYKEGVSTQTELLDQRLALEQARANRAIAARDLQVARVRLALIRDLPATAPNGGIIVNAQQATANGIPQQQATVVPAAATSLGVTP